jgi:hypothetical protein
VGDDLAAADPAPAEAQTFFAMLDLAGMDPNLKLQHR